MASICKCCSRPETSKCKCCSSQGTSVCKCCSILVAPLASMCECCNRNKVQELGSTKKAWISSSLLDGEVCNGRFSKKWFVIIILIAVFTIIVLSVSISVPLALKSSSSKGVEGKSYMELNEWSKCTKSCGGGIQIRNRTDCITGYCNGNTSESQACNTWECPKLQDINCTGETLDICNTSMNAWKVKELNTSYISLENCIPSEMVNVSELLLFVSQSELIDYGKYEIVSVDNVDTISCVIRLTSPLSKLSNLTSHPCEIIAQRFPTFGNVTLSESCTLTCHARSESGLGGIIALRTTNLVIDNTSRIEVNGKGYHGGVNKTNTGIGGMGGETFSCLNETFGKGGELGQSGAGAGGAGSAYSIAGGPGGVHAGGGGAVLQSSTKMDGAGGGGGGGHFSGGAGGGGGGCDSEFGVNGGMAIQEIGRFAGYGGRSCPNPNDLLDTTTNHEPHSGKGGESASRQSRTGVEGGSGGGGGGKQYGSLDFENRLSLGGGGGQGGGFIYYFSNISSVSGRGGRGGNGGGLILLFLETLTLQGKIEANGEQGQCSKDAVYHTGKTARGSGAGGSVVIFTKVLHGDPSTKITVNGGSRLINDNCGYLSGGGGTGGVGRWVVKFANATLLKSED